MRDQINQLAGTIKKLSEQQKQTASWAKGVVASINTSNATLGVTLSGSGVTVTGVRYVQNYNPVVGDPVLVAKQRNSYTVFDRLTTVANTDPTTKANAAQTSANTAQTSANNAQTSANNAQSTANTANTNANNALSQAHTHADNIQVNWTTITPTAQAITQKTVTGLGLDSGVNYVAVASANTTVPGPSDNTFDGGPGPGRDIAVGTGGPVGDPPMPSNTTLYLYIYRDNATDTVVTYIVSQTNNPII